MWIYTLYQKKKKKQQLNISSTYDRCCFKYTLLALPMIFPEVLSSSHITYNTMILAPSRCLRGKSSVHPHPSFRLEGVRPLFWNTFRWSVFLLVFLCWDDLTKREKQSFRFCFIFPTGATSPEAAWLQHEGVESPSGSWAASRDFLGPGACAPASSPLSLKLHSGWAGLPHELCSAHLSPVEVSSCFSSSHLVFTHWAKCSSRAERSPLRESSASGQIFFLLQKLLPPPLIYINLTNKSTQQKDFMHTWHRLCTKKGYNAQKAAVTQRNLHTRVHNSQL